MLKPWLELARISNLPTAWTNVLAGWLLAGGNLQDPRLLWLLLGGSLLYSGGMILNDAADAKWDREHRKERPIPRGAVSVGAAWRTGLLALVLGVAAVSCLGGANSGLACLLVAAILLYDFCHKSWTGSVIVMGACRTLLYLVAASAVAHPIFGVTMGSTTLFTLKMNGVVIAPPNPLTWPFRYQFPTGGVLWLSALAIGLYIVGVTKTARMESLGAEARVRRAVNQPLLVFVPAIAAALTYSRHHDPRVWILIAAFVGMAIHSIRVMHQGGPDIGRAVGILLAGIAVVDGLAVATVSFPLACGFVALAPLLRLWQRWISAT